EVAALEYIGLARFLTGAQDQLRRAFWMLFPKLLDLGVGILPLRDARPPGAENGFFLGGGSALGRHRKQFSHAGWQRIGDGLFVVGHRKAETAEIVVLIVVAVPAAVVLRELECQQANLVEIERLVENENCLARHVAAARTEIDAPGRFVLTID